VELLEKTQQSILKLFSAEEVERAVSGSGGSSKEGAAAAAAATAAGGGGSSKEAKEGDEFDPALSSAIADLHKFSMMQV
jgi:hypothetical protein